MPMDVAWRNPCEAHERLVSLPAHYPSRNPISLASSRAIYVRDPRHQVARDPLDGGSRHGPNNCYDFHLTNSLK